MGAITTLETKLDDVSKNFPLQLPQNARKTIVEYLPWVNLVLGVFALWTAWSVWHWAHYVNSYVNSLTQALNGTTISTQRMSSAIWLGVLTLVIEGLMLVLAFPRTRARKKTGWDLLFYAALVNVAYGLIISFSEYGGFGRFILSLIVSAMGLYFLFQIRSYYTGRKSVGASAEKDT